MIARCRGAFIGAGASHCARWMASRARAGAFLQDAARSKARGRLKLDPKRRLRQLSGERAPSEAPAGDRLDFVVIVTPNHQHFRRQSGFSKRLQRRRQTGHAQPREAQKLAVT